MQIRSRRQTYVALVAIAVGSMAAGLILPFAVGDRISDAGSLSAAPLDAEPFDDGGVGDDPLDGPSDGLTGDVTDTTIAELGPAGPDATGSPIGSNGQIAPAGPTAQGSPRPERSPAPAGATLRASDVGVTPTTIKVGVVLLDLATARSVGLAPDNYTVEDQKQVYDMFFGQVNDGGGINGRKVQPVYAVADPFQASTAEAACLELTRDEKVFAVVAVAGFRGTASLCITRDNRTPLIAQGHHPREYFRASGNLLVTDLPSSERVAQQYVGSLDRLGLLRGKTIGVVTNRNAANGEKQGGDAVVAELERRGFRIAHRADLSEDLSTGAGQIPVQVQQMRGAGVDAVVLASNFLYSTQFAQAAHGQNYRPAYFASHIGDMTSDALARNMPESYNGAIAIGSARFNHDARAKLPEPAVERECRQQFNSKTGKNYPYGGENPVLPGCAQVRLFTSAATAAGPELTRGSYTAAMQRTGAFPWPGLLPGSLAVGKLDYADQARPLQWRSSCRCYHIAGEARRV